MILDINYIGKNQCYTYNLYFSPLIPVNVSKFTSFAINDGYLSSLLNAHTKRLFFPHLVFHLNVQCQYFWLLFKKNFTDE